MRNYFKQFVPTIHENGYSLLVHELWPKKPKANVVVAPTVVWVPSQRSLAPSVALVTSVANDKGDNEMVLGAVHRSSGFFLTAEDNSRKPQLGDRLMKGLCNQSSPQTGYFFQFVM